MNKNGPKTRDNTPRPLGQSLFFSADFLDKGDGTKKRREISSRLLKATLCVVCATCIAPILFWRKSAPKLSRREVLFCVFYGTHTRCSKRQPPSDEFPSRFSRQRGQCKRRAMCLCEDLGPDLCGATVFRGGCSPFLENIGSEVHPRGVSYRACQACNTVS